jgi:uncharacterized protein with HEPN domain
LPFKNSVQALEDIAESIARIEEFTAGMTIDAFRRDARTAAAVRLGDQAADLCPGLPWHNIRGMGNQAAVLAALTRLG